VVSGLDHRGLPARGELKIEHNESGRILRCEPPWRFRVSWIYEDSYSELEVRLGPVGNGATVVEFEHLMGWRNSPARA
jgi:hypothetical protein